MLPLAAAAIRAANSSDAHQANQFPPLSLQNTRGGVQILRFRAEKGLPPQLKPAKQRGDGGDRIHMHVDRDGGVGTVMLLALGATARFALDEGSRCHRVRPAAHSSDALRSHFFWLPWCFLRG